MQSSSLLARNFHWTRDVTLNHDKTLAKGGGQPPGIERVQTVTEMIFLGLNQPPISTCFSPASKHSATLSRWYCGCQVCQTCSTDSVMEQHIICYAHLHVCLIQAKKVMAVVTFPLHNLKQLLHSFKSLLSITYLCKNDNAQSDYHTMQINFHPLLVVPYT